MGLERCILDGILVVSRHRTGPSTRECRPTIPQGFSSVWGTPVGPVSVLTDGCPTLGELSLRLRIRDVRGLSTFL